MDAHPNRQLCIVKLCQKLYTGASSLIGHIRPLAGLADKNVNIR